MGALALLLDRIATSSTAPVPAEPVLSPSRGGLTAAAEEQLAPPPGRVRARTVSIKRLSKRELERGRIANPVVDYERPHSREDCEPKPQPCPWCGKNAVMKLVAKEFQDGSSGTSVRKTQSAELRGEKQTLGEPLAGSLPVQKGACGSGQQPKNGQHNELRLQSNEARGKSEEQDSRIHGLEQHDSSVRRSSRQVLSPLRRETNKGLPSVESKLSGIPERHGQKANEPTFSGQDQHQRGLRAGKLPVGDSDGAGAQQAYVACPHCERRVSYRSGVGGTNGAWIHYDQGTASARMGPAESLGYARALQSCRPCIHVSCRHNLYLDVNDSTGSIKLNFPDREVWELPETCALDVADRGGITLEEVGEIMGLTRERIRQLETRGLAKLKALDQIAALQDYLEEDPRPALTAAQRKIAVELGHPPPEA